MSHTTHFHPNKLEISVHLKAAMLKQLKFLHEVDDNPWVHSGPLLRNAIRRYEECWLPLASEHSSLQPPLDIHWVWHVHMLAPYYYEKDCLALVSAVVQHDVPKDPHHRLDHTKKLWEQRYMEPFNVDSHTKVENENQNYRSKCSYDIEAAVSRQKVFYYQVSLPHYCDSKFLDNAILRYRKFLFLKQQNPDAFLVPCYDFDLAWHAHQVEPASYKKDTCAILGRMYNHNDAVNDRSANSKLIEAEKTTRSLWKQLFEEDFSICGAMYRGEPPRGKLYRLSADEIVNLSTKISEVTLKSVSFENFVEGEKFESRVMLECGANSRCLMKLRGPRTHFTMSHKFIFDTSVHKSLQLTVERKTGIMCCGASEQIGSFNFALGEVVETYPVTGTEDLMLRAYGEHSPDVVVPSVTITAAVGSWRRGPFVMKLEPGSFQSYTIPEDIEQLWGPVPLQQLPPDVPNKCYVASHRWADYLG